MTESNSIIVWWSSFPKPLLYIFGIISAPCSVSMRYRWQLPNAYNKSTQILFENTRRKKDIFQVITVVLFINKIAVTKTNRSLT